MWRLRTVIAILALVAVACGGESDAGGDAEPDTAGLVNEDTNEDEDDRGSNDPGRQGDIELDVEVEEGEEPPTRDETPPDPEYVELVATGLLEGGFSTFPRCDFREDEEGESLHVFFAYFDESRDEIPSVDVVMRIRPFDFEGAFEMESDGSEDGDLEVEFRHGDFSYSEDLTATLSGVVTRSESESGLPLAVISFTGTYDGEVGSGGFEGESSCIALAG